MAEMTLARALTAGLHEALAGDDRVMLLGEDVAANGGVFINPALTEPFGLTLLEAAASGLPVVATENGGPVDIIANCKNGRYTKGCVS
mgnify:CR=1 FL=1